MGQRKGFSYVYTKEKYNSYKKLSVEQKLTWLEKMNRFLHDFMPDKSKLLREKLRQGKI